MALVKIEETWINPDHVVLVKKVDWGGCRIALAGPVPSIDSTLAMRDVVKILNATPA